MMSSNIENLVKSIEEAEIQKKEMNEYEAMAEAMEKEKISVTTRLDSMQVAYLDMLAEKCDVSRAAMLSELAINALMDVMEKTGVTEEFFQKLVEQLKEEVAENV